MAPIAPCAPVVAPILSHRTQVPCIVQIVAIRMSAVWATTNKGVWHDPLLRSWFERLRQTRLASDMMPFSLDGDPFLVFLESCHSHMQKVLRQGVEPCSCPLRALQ